MINPANNLQKLRIRLEYVHPWPNHLGMFVARAQGWYAEAGLDVSIISDGWDRGTPAQLIAQDEYDMAPIRLGELLELQHGTDVPLIGVATLNQRQLGGIFSLKSKGIQRFRDLEGKTVSMPSVPRLEQMVCEAVTADGGDFSKVITIYTGLWEGDMRAVEKGYYDAGFSVLGWESMQGVLPFSEGVRLDFDSVNVAPHHSYFLCFRKDFCQAHADIVRRFLSITARGYQFAAKYPDKAITHCGSAMCNVDPAVMKNSLNFMKDSWFDEQGRWGVMDFNLVRSYTQWMISGGFTTAGIDDIPKAVTNEYLPY